jgi:hypothetical protein
MKRRFIMVLATWVIFVHAFAQSFINLRKISSFTLDFLEEETRNYRNHYLIAHSVLINKSRTQAYEHAATTCR